MAWNGSNGASAPKQKPVNGARAVSKGAIKGLVALVAVCVIGAVVYFLISQPATKPAKPAEKEGRGMIRDFAPTIPSKAVEIGNDSASVSNGEQIVEVAPIIITPRSSRKGRVMTLPDGSVVTNRSVQVFKRDFEKGLMLALRPGSMAANQLRLLLQKYSDDQIMAMLKEMTIPAPEDSEQVAAIKNNVQALKERMLIAIGNGASVSDAIEEMRFQCASDGIIRAQVYKAKLEALRSGDPEYVEKMVRVGNDALEARGLRPLPSADLESSDLVGDDDFEK